jgi:hypothetical protein
MHNAPRYRKLFLPSGLQKSSVDVTGIVKEDKEEQEDKESKRRRRQGGGGREGDEARGGND